MSFSSDSAMYRLSLMSTTAGGGQNVTLAYFGPDPNKTASRCIVLIDERWRGCPRAPCGSFRVSEKMHQEDLLLTDALPAADTRLVERLRAGDSEAGRCFVRDHYPAIYRYLLYLTGRPETAEDLAQETFLQAWRRLDTFDDGAPLRPWLHRIA